VSDGDLVSFPERFNMARYYLDARVEAGDGERLALICGDERRTYAELQRRSRRAARLLADLGVGRGDRVLLVLPDGLELPELLLGCLTAGGVVAMVNVVLGSEDYVECLRYTGAKVALVHAMSLERFAAAAAATDAHLLSVGAPAPGPRWARYDEALAGVSEELTPVDTHRDDPALWLFTSGTTGAARAAVHTHAHFPYATETYGKGVLGLRPDDVTLSVPKLFFGYATGNNLLFPLAAGAAAVMLEERSTPEAIFAAIARHRPTLLTSVPTMISRMLDHEAAGQADLSCLRLCTSAGEALPPRLRRRWLETFGVEVLDGLGSAEMCHIYLSQRPGQTRPGSLGREVEGYDFRLVDAEGEEVAEGEPGRIWVRGGSAARGYHDDAAKSAATFRPDGWVITADVCRRDAEGNVWYIGRADDLLKVGGVFVAPGEVEDCLLGHEAVRECAVVSATGPGGLTVPRAVVVTAPGFVSGDPLARELQRHVKQRLAPHKYPRQVAFIEALPRNERGKVLRRELI
jgi:benzoate-CoA ligase